MASPALTRFRIREFELDAATGELRKAGTLVKLQPQPFRVLLLLVERAGQLVTREEIQRCLWTDSTFVDFEHGINFSINQIREALEDDAEEPRYVETLPRRGYRFIAPVEPQRAKRRSSKRIFSLIAAPALAALLFALLWKWLPWAPRKAAATNGRRAVAVIEIENLSQNPSLDWLGDGVVDLLTTDLAQARNLDVISSERVRSLISREVKPGENLPASQAQGVAQKAGADLFVSGGLLKMGQGFRLDLRVQDTATGKVLLADKVEGDSPQAIFSMVDESTARIVSQLAPAEAAMQPNAARLTSNLDALHAYEEGISHVDRVFNDQAAASFRLATQLDPQFAMAYYQLAAVVHSFSEGREALTRAAQLAERQGLPEQQRLLIRARQLQGDGRSEEATQTFQTIVRRFPKEIEPRFHLGQLLKFQGRLSESAAVLEEAAQLDGRRTYIYNSLAYTYAFQGDLSRALEAVDRYAAALPPNDPNPIDTRADVYAIGGQFDSAVAEYKKNVESRPEFGLTRQKVALVYLLAGRNREAEEAAQTASQKTSGADRAYTRNVQGDVALGCGEFARAATYFEEAARLFGTDHPLLARAESWKAAEIYFEQREPRAALAWAKRTHGFGAAEVRGVAYLLLGNGAEAEKEFVAAHSAMAPFFSDYMIEKLINLDRLRAASYSGQWHQVIAGWPELPGWLKQVDAFFPGRAYAEMGMQSQAQAELRNALRWVSPGNLVGSYSDFFCDELTQFYLGKVLEHDGKTAEAIEAYSAFLSHFEHSTARLPQIGQARTALHRLK
ncbi:MAG TPA: winged helix-turn-helix domain-containing protein [Candidatus Acidoferrum sp.]|nr:winged helix-turn-helix domain-containing protein [Candidatus Acidoferrum sp.]